MSEREQRIQRVRKAIDKIKRAYPISAYDELKQPEKDEMLTMAAYIGDVEAVYHLLRVGAKYTKPVESFQFGNVNYDQLSLLTLVCWQALLPEENKRYEEIIYLLLPQTETWEWKWVGKYREKFRGKLCVTCNCLFNPWRLFLHRWSPMRFFIPYNYDNVLNNAVEKGIFVKAFQCNRCKKAICSQCFHKEKPYYSSKSFNVLRDTNLGRKTFEMLDGICSGCCEYQFVPSPWSKDTWRYYPGRYRPAIDLVQMLVRRPECWLNKLPDPIIAIITNYVIGS